MEAAMAFDTIISNGSVVTATDTYLADVAIADGKIAAMGKDLPRANATKVLDASGKLVLPGGIDVHTHLDMPFGGTTSADDFETGTRAAAFGGTTSFKLFMAYPGVFMLDDASIFRALQTTAENGGLICMHAENGSAIDVIVQQALAEGKTAPKYHALTRPTTAEAEAVSRAIALSEMAGAPIYIVHLSCSEALEKVREARDRGLPVYAETCPQYLYLSLENFDVPDFEGAKYVFTPPLREKWHQEKLWNGLKQDHLQVVSTDHCPFCFKEQKELGRGDFTKIPNGGPGVEHRMSLIYSGGVAPGRFSVNRFVELVSTTPAKLFGLYPRKGTIAVGSDADLVIFDPQRKHTISAKTHHMRVDYSMFEGIQVTGMPDVVLSRGRVVVDGGKFLGRAGQGEFLRRSSYSKANG
jgi:dihydropyrimidinase